MTRLHWLPLQTRLAIHQEALAALEQHAQAHHAAIAQHHQGLAVTGQQMLRVQGAIAELEALLDVVEKEESGG